MWDNTGDTATNDPQKKSATDAPQRKLDMKKTKTVFKGIKIDPVAKTLTVSCIIDQDMWLGGNIVNIKGVDIEGTTKIPEGSEPRSPWVFKGHGHVQIFEKMVKTSFLFSDHLLCYKNWDE